MIAALVAGAISGIVGLLVLTSTAVGALLVWLIGTTGDPISMSVADSQWGIQT